MEKMQCEGPKNTAVSQGIYEVLRIRIAIRTQKLAQKLAKWGRHPPSEGKIRPPMRGRVRGAGSPNPTLRKRRPGGRVSLTRPQLGLPAAWMETGLT